MIKIRKIIKTKKDFDRMMKLLAERINDNNRISENAMHDGMIIGFMFYNNFTIDLILDNDIGRVLDGSLQQLKLIARWLIDNEDYICKIVK